ncbi:hypothetical protein [Thalassotalea mangrovi]|uniref:Uncharacterized protein n=1 Tax=Thalassotalea mangrovi TaxID=2572245 RepID=A0A4U1B1P8_9GAMM|nr:hypothetical protein [Thalassotalea mangrovi]TKB43367.1 hypothetical protein E8M12_15350 [Thalassotalea mangrovi]
MKTVKWFKNPEMIIALSALFIGLLTAVISIYSAYIDRAYARASVWPNVELYRSFERHSFSYGVVNSGTGPALIKYARVALDGSPIKRWSDIEAFADISQSHIHNRTLPAEQTITPLIYEGEAIAAILEVDNRLAIELCYCSIYGDCWVVDRNNTPKPVNECVIEHQHAFLQ